jgi:alkaline phosphatase
VTEGNELLEQAVAEALAEDRKLFAAFGGPDDYMEHPMPVDDPGHPRFERTGEASENPSLAHATRAALDVLDARGGDQGFFVMIEGGDIDWANHANDFAWMLGAMYNFEEAVKEAVDYVDQGHGGLSWDNTLIVVTSDHGNDYMRISPQPGSTLRHGALPRQILDNSRPFGFFAYPDGEVLYESDEHTNELVTLAAKGAGAELFGAEAVTGWYGSAGTTAHAIVDNTHIHEIMRRAYETSGADHLILFIGDGMQEAHEAAYSKYRYDSYDGLVWDQSKGVFDCFTLCATWDIDTYNRLAMSAHAAAYDAGEIDPRIGYDPARGGSAPAFLFNASAVAQKDYFLTWRPGYRVTLDSAEPPATDSASAATALATGWKTDSGNIAWMAGDPEGGELTTLAEYARLQRSGAFGVVSTVPFTHATPGAFVSHNTNRGNSAAMSDEIVLRTRPDVVIGGGHPDWYGRNTYTSAEAYGLFDWYAGLWYPDTRLIDNSQLFDIMAEFLGVTSTQPF